MARKATLGPQQSNTQPSDGFKCIGPCRRTYNKQRTNFPAVQSVLYAGNNYYLPWCNKCVDAFYSRYRDDCGLDEAEAIKRLCSKFDIYWNKKVYNSMPSAATATSSRLRTYLSKTNITQYSGKTYDDTIAEEEKALAEEYAQREEIIAQEVAARVTKQEEAVKEEIVVPKKLLDFWGRGRDPESYSDLQARYDKLTSGCTVDGPATEMLVKQACLSEYEIDRLQLEGKSFEKQQASLVNTLGSLNLKPSQLREAEKNSGLDTMPLGVGAQHWELTRPIPDPDPDWVDVDGIAKYMMTWYTGASQRMFGVDGEYADLFRDAIDEYTVHRPDVDADNEQEAVSFILRGGKDDAK